MADRFGHSFADDGSGYADITNVIDPDAVTALDVQLALFKELIPDPTSATAGVKPDFDEIMPHTAAKLRAEFDLLAAAIDAAPTGT